MPRAKPDPHRLAGHVVIDDKPHARLITIGDDIFPYYTQGDITVTPAKLSGPGCGGNEDDPTMVVIHIPVLAESVRWVEPEAE
jgi:hypothetical protein